MVLRIEAPPKYSLNYDSYQDDPPFACGPSLQTRTQQDVKNASFPISNGSLRNPDVGSSNIETAVEDTDATNGTTINPHRSHPLTNLLPIARATKDGNYIHAMPNEDMCDVDVVRWVSTEGADNIQIGLTRKAIMAECQLLCQQQPHLGNGHCPNGIRDVTTTLSIASDPEPFQAKEYIDIGELPDDEKPEQEEVPIQCPEATFEWLVTRCDQMRQQPKKILGPLIIHLMDPTKRTSSPYTKGSEPCERPDYWPPEWVSEYKGVHHLSKPPLDKLLPWFFLLPYHKESVAKTCLENAREQYHGQRIEDWAAMLEIAVNEFAHLRRTKTQGFAWEQAKAEIRSFREACRVVRECLAGVDRDEDDVFLADKVPRLAQRGKSGKKAGPGSKRKRPAKAGNGSKAKRSATAAPGNRQGQSVCETPTHDEDGSETELDEDNASFQGESPEQGPSAVGRRGDESRKSTLNGEEQFVTSSSCEQLQSLMRCTSLEAEESQMTSGFSGHIRRDTKMPKGPGSLVVQPVCKSINSVQFLPIETLESYQTHRDGVAVTAPLEQAEYPLTPPQSAQASFSNGETYPDSFISLAESEPNHFYEPTPYDGLAINGFPLSLSRGFHPPMAFYPLNVDPSWSQGGFSFNGVGATSMQDYAPTVSQEYVESGFGQHQS